MKHISKCNRCVRTVFSLMILTGVCAKAAPGKSLDPYVGEWVLSVHSGPGQEVSRDELTITLKISEKGNFYNVALDIPPGTIGTESGLFSWAAFIAQSDKSLKNMTESLAKRKYAGEYLMDVDGESITQQKGAATFNYKLKTGLLCETALGCFVKGNQNALIERIRGQQRDKAKAEASAKADAEAYARASAEADAKAAAEAESKANAAAEAESRKPQLIEDKTVKISPREDIVMGLYLGLRSRVSLNVAVEEIDLVNSVSGRNNAVRVILLDEVGYAEWGKLKDNFSLFHPFRRVEKQNAEAITGPCSTLLKTDLQGRSRSECVLAPGKYYVVFYDGYPGFRNIGQSNELSPYDFTAAVKITTQITEPIVDTIGSGNAYKLGKDGAVSTTTVDKIVGTWSGLVNEPGRKPYKMVMLMKSPESGNTRYELEDCVGSLSGGSSGHNSYRYAETITNGPCLNAYITLQFTDTGALSLLSEAVYKGKIYNVTAMLEKDSN